MEVPGLLVPVNRILLSMISDVKVLNNVIGRRSAITAHRVRGSLS